METIQIEQLIKLIETWIESDSRTNGRNSVERFAVLAKVSPTFIRTLIRGRYKSTPKHSTLSNMCSVLGVSPLDLYQDKRAA